MRLPLLGGAYQARSIIANAQRCVNLYPEKNQGDAPVPVTQYLTPGLDLLIAGDGFSTVRCTYRSSKGELFEVIGTNVYYTDSTFTRHLLGTIAPGVTTVSMADNGLVIVLVDGSSNGYAIDMIAHTFGQINDPSFYGADRADYIDTFFVFNRPGTNQWYISLSLVSYEMLTIGSGAILASSILVPGTLYTNGTYTNVALTGGSGTGATANIIVLGGAITTVTIVNKGQDYVIEDVLSATAVSLGGTGSGFVYSVDDVGGGFDPLDIASKSAYPDNIVCVIVMHQEIWIIGTLTSEIWFNAGAADFAFQQMPQGIIEHGCIAKYSVATQDLSVYWLSQDKQGQTIVMRGAAYIANRISTHAIENEFSKYSIISDAIGFIYQQNGHAFYVLTFPTANKTWVFDQSTEEWHERAWTNNNGELNRHRANCAANAYNKIVVGDWQNGNLYTLNMNKYTDVGQPIVRIRSFPHMLNEGDRVSYKSFQADMSVGQDLLPEDPQVYLRWSDNRGRSYSNPIAQTMGATGEYLINLQWQRLGLARDRVFELMWSIDADTALNGAFIDSQSAAS